LFGDWKWFGIFTFTGLQSRKQRKQQQQTQMTVLMLKNCSLKSMTINPDAMNGRRECAPLEETNKYLAKGFQYTTKRVPYYPLALVH